MRESGEQPEQPVMREAFRANFNIYDIPEILATPCCSQIAVTKERVRSVLRERYGKAVEWLVGTELDDGISGRTWEQYG
jgi:phage gp36-like protein